MSGVPGRTSRLKLVTADGAISISIGAEGGGAPPVQAPKSHGLTCTMQALSGPVVQVTGSAPASVCGFWAPGIGSATFITESGNSLICWLPMADWLAPAAWAWAVALMIRGTVGTSLGSSFCSSPPSSMSSRMLSGGGVEPPPSVVWVPPWGAGPGVEPDDEPDGADPEEEVVAGVVPPPPSACCGPPPSVCGPPSACPGPLGSTGTGVIGAPGSYWHQVVLPEPRKNSKGCCWAVRMQSLRNPTGTRRGKVAWMAPLSQRRAWPQEYFEPAPCTWAVKFGIAGRLMLEAPHTLATQAA